LSPATESPLEDGEAGELGVLLHVAVDTLAGNSQGAGRFGFTTNHLAILDRLATLAFPNLKDKVSGKVVGFAEGWWL
jgi:hypothetical protein